MIGILMFATGLLVCGAVPKTWTLVVFYGLVSGLGMGVKATVELMAVNLYFDKKRVIANGIFFSGSPLGYFISAPILAYILENYSLQATFYFQAGTVLVNCLLLCLVKTPKQEDFVEIDESCDPRQSFGQRMKSTLKCMFPKSVITNIPLQLNLMRTLIYGMTYLVPAYYIPSVMVQNGFTTTEAALAVTLIGVFSLIGRLGASLLNRLSGYALEILPLLNIGCASTLIIMISLQESLTWVYVACGLFGFFSGPIPVFGPTCVGYFVGTEYDAFGCAIGLDMFMEGVGTLLGKRLTHILKYS